jgi:molybdopterin converting factor subunit 1
VRVKLLFFATHRRVAGRSEAEAELPELATVRDAAKHAEENYGLSLAGSLVAVNEDYAPAERALMEGDTVAFIPPVAGGSEPDLLLVSAEPLDLEALRAAIVRPEWGGQAFFTGTTRTPNAGVEVLYLEYEAYESMVLAVMRRLAAEARERWQVGAILLAHRIGVVRPGETSIIVGVASAHRRAALEALPYLVDEAKARLPVWKLEVGAGGERWVEGSTSAGEPL